MSIRLARWCCQCEKMLPRKCLLCVKHPNRKPRIVEIFDAPPVISKNDCGCLKIRCQRPNCLNTMWRHPRADGTLGHKNHFCSPACVRIVTAAAKVAKRIAAPCSCGCGRVTLRPASNMRAKHTYFSQLCHFRHRVALNAAKRRAKFAYADIQSIACYSETCRGAVTDHKKTSRREYECVRCRRRAKEAAANMKGVRA